MSFRTVLLSFLIGSAAATSPCGTVAPGVPPPPPPPPGNPCEKQGLTVAEGVGIGLGTAAGLVGIGIGIDVAVKTPAPPCATSPPTVTELPGGPEGAKNKLAGNTTTAAPTTSYSMTPWDFSSGSLGDSSASSMSSASSDSLASDASSGSRFTHSGTSGFYLPILIWFVFICCLCICCIGAVCSAGKKKKGGKDKKKKKKHHDDSDSSDDDKKSKIKDMPLPAPDPEAPSVEVEPLLPFAPLMPLAPTPVVQSYQMMVAPTPTYTYAAPTPTYAAPQARAISFSKQYQRQEEQKPKKFKVTVVKLETQHGDNGADWFVKVKYDGEEKKTSVKKNAGHGTHHWHETFEFDLKHGHDLKFEVEDEDSGHNDHLGKSDLGCKPEHYDKGKDHHHDFHVDKDGVDYHRGKLTVKLELINGPVSYSTTSYAAPQTASSTQYATQQYAGSQQYAGYSPLMGTQQQYAVGGQQQYSGGYAGSVV